MKLPEIGEIITTERALKLCRHFNFDYLVARIKADPESFMDWKFDGCSCLEDEILGLLTGCDWREITFRCCLPHDLCYAYGDPGNGAERKQADIRLYSDLVDKAGMKKWMAAVFLAGVRIGGAESLRRTFSWGFARVKHKKTS